MFVMKLLICVPQGKQVPKPENQGQAYGQKQKAFPGLMDEMLNMEKTK